MDWPRGESAHGGYEMQDESTSYLGYNYLDQGQELMPHLDFYGSGPPLVSPRPPSLMRASSISLDIQQ